MGKFDLIPMSDEKLPDVVGYVANGGSLIDYCAQNRIEYNKAIMWIYDNKFPARQAAYEGSMKARSEYVVQAILGELKAIGTINMREAFNQDGTLKTLDDMPEELTRVIASIEVHELYEYEGEEKVLKGYCKKVKLNDKIRALELLGKNLKLFIETKVVTGKIEHTHSVDGESVENMLAQIKSRRKAPIDVQASSVMTVAPEDF